MARSQFHAAPFFSVLVTLTGKREKERDGMDVFFEVSFSTLILGGEGAGFFESGEEKIRSRFRRYTSLCTADCIKYLRGVLREGYTSRRFVRAERE